MPLRIAESAWASKSERRGKPPGDFKPRDILDS